MDSINDVLDAAKAYCREHTAEATYQYYISDIKAVSFENSNTITLEIRNAFILGIVSDRYTAMLKDAFKSVLGFDVDLVFVTPKKEEEPEKPKLDEKALPSGRYDFTFENFIKGPSNQFAYAAAQAVAANPSGAYNPLFIYGPSGLGKTHLLNAIQVEIKKNHPDFNIVYVDCEMFTNEIITAVKTATTEQFRQKYRQADVLLIDDIQFLAGKESTQEEFFHTFNALYESKKQIIISSDKPPKEIETLEERLRSRFEWGLTVDIQSPDYETRMAILRKKEELEGYNIDNEVIKYIATNIKSNIRELEGALTKIVALSKLNKKEINIELAEEALKDLISPGEVKNITPEYIISIVAEQFEVSADEIISQKRSRNIARPRQIVMYLCRSLLNIPLQEVGRALGGRDHTTIMHGVDKITEELKTDASLQNTMDILKKKISPQ